MDLTFTHKIRIFFVEDSHFFARVLLNKLKKYEQIIVDYFPDGETMLKNLDLEPDIIILDFYLDSVNSNAKNGHQILDILQHERPEIPVVILSSQQDIQRAVDLLKIGATDYIVKNPDTFYHHLIKAINNIVRINELEVELNTLKIKYRNERLRMLTVFSIVVLAVLILLLINYSFN